MRSTVRRTSALLLSALVSVLALATPASAQAQQPLSVFVLVVDGLRPSEIGALTPNLSEFRAAGTSFEASRSVLIAETIPNHVAMMTGVYPDRSNIPANDFWDRTGEPESVDLQDPVELTADTLFTTLGRACPSLSTAAVLSKRYLHEIFQAGGQNVAPDFHWRPAPLVADDFAPGPMTMDVALRELPARQFMFVNLGDTDRSGHFDAGAALLLTGALTTARQAALALDDALVGQFVQALKDAGRWDRSVVFVVSDHGFDWSTPERFVDLPSVLETVVPGRTAAIGVGGAGLVYLEDADAADAKQVLLMARQAIVALPGVTAVWYREPNPLDPAGNAPPDVHLNSENAGDLIVLADDHYRIAEPNEPAFGVLGNHGHPITRHNTFLVGGGAPFVRRGAVIRPSVAAPTPMDVLPEQSENVDVAPTVAWLLGLATSDYDGRVLREAFSIDSSPSDCGTLRASAGTAAIATPPAGGGSPASPAPSGGTPVGAAPGAPPSLPATGGDLAPSALFVGIAAVALATRRAVARSWKR